MSRSYHLDAAQAMLNAAPGTEFTAASLAEATGLSLDDASKKASTIKSGDALRKLTGLGLATLVSRGKYTIVADKAQAAIKAVEPVAEPAQQGELESV